MASFIIRNHNLILSACFLIGALKTIFCRKDNIKIDQSNNEAAKLFANFVQVFPEDGTSFTETQTTTHQPLDNIDWMDIPMPTQKSHFADFPIPNKAEKWMAAIGQAVAGDGLLSSKVLATIKSPFDFLSNDVYFRWIHRLSDFQVATIAELTDIKKYESGKAPIVLFGRYQFTHPNFEGNFVSFDSLALDELYAKKKQHSRISKKLVAIGMPNQNWGYLSTYFLNRTVHWSFTLTGGDSNPLSAAYVTPCEQIESFLNDRNVVMLVVNQHHNCSHPKIISMPLGVRDPKIIWKLIRKQNYQGTKKTNLLFFAGVQFGHRSAIVSCVRRRMNKELVAFSGKLNLNAYYSQLMASYAILPLSGLGYDSFAIWEALALG